MSSINMSVYKDISKTRCLNSTKFSLHGLILLCDNGHMICTFDFVDDIVFSCNGPIASCVLLNGKSIAQQPGVDGF